MKRSYVIALVLLVLCAGHAGADGIPDTGALTYSGVLQDARGAAVVGDHNLEIKLWSAADGGNAPVCTTGSQTPALSDGRFTLTLPDDCTRAVGASANLWVDVLVDGGSLGRSKLSVVPYAVEAAHSSSADNARMAALADEAAHATTATSATNADHASRAADADNATHANTADDASHADNADEATHAANADLAQSALQLVEPNKHKYFMRWATDGVLRFWVDNTNVKNFIIDHPADPDRYLVHTTLEGPENAVFYRGTSQLENGFAEVMLPAYFEAATRKEGRTVLLTPKFTSASEPLTPLAASGVQYGRFIVRAIGGDNPSQAFDWETKAVRADVALLVSEPRRDDIVVHGSGPYKYFSRKE